MEEGPKSHIVTDGISDLHNLTLSFVNRFSDLLTGVLIKASDVSKKPGSGDFNYEEAVGVMIVSKSRLIVELLVFWRMQRHLKTLLMKWRSLQKRKRSIHRFIEL